MATDTLSAPTRLIDPDDPAATSATFDLQGWLDSIPWSTVLPTVADPEAGIEEDSPEDAADKLALRIELTKYNPLLFAVLYFVDHIRDEAGQFTLADAHLEWARLAQDWMLPVDAPQRNRHAFLAPRSTGKSTWWLLILPMWAAAHGWVKFAAAFADSAPQAEMHLDTFRKELRTNANLRRDFPDLCGAGRRPKTAAEADTKSMVTTRSGFVFAAKGIDASSLGMKVGSRRPDLLLLDDVEPDESSYSAYQMAKRLVTIKDAVLPLNIRARVVLSGTVTMPGSITHQLVRHAKGELDPDDKATAWISEESFQVHHHLPLIAEDDGTRRSIWPAKWPAEYLAALEHTRSYKKNMLNDPMAVDSDYWAEDDITYGTFPTARTYLSVDGAVTTKKTSDYTGLAVVSWAPATPARDDRPAVPARCLVEHAQAVRLKGEPLRQKALQIIESFPHIGAILVESNQGGDLWEQTFHHMPVKVITTNNPEPKEVRAGLVLHQYQLVPPRVVHAKPLPELEGQLVGFPKAPFDDLVDAVGTPVLRFLKPPVRKKAAVRSVSPR